MKTQKRHAERKLARGEQPTKTRYENIISVTGSAKPSKCSRTPIKKKKKKNHLSNPRISSHR